MLGRARHSGSSSTSHAHILRFLCVTWLELRRWWWWWGGPLIRRRPRTPANDRWRLGLRNPPLSAFAAPPLALIVCLKWLSEVSLPFRPSSSARSHLTLSDDGARRDTPAPPLGVGRGPEGRAPLVKAEMKRAAVGIGWSRPASKRCRRGPSLELRWRATHQWSGAANSQRLKSSASLLPPFSSSNNRPAPQRPALIYHYHASLAI